MHLDVIQKYIMYRDVVHVLLRLPYRKSCGHSVHSLCIYVNLIL